MKNRTIAVYPVAEQDMFRERMKGALRGLKVVDQLRPIANAYGIRGASRMSKDDILEAITRYATGATIGNAFAEAIPAGGHRPLVTAMHERGWVGIPDDPNEYQWSRTVNDDACPLFSLRIAAVPGGDTAILAQGDTSLRGSVLARRVMHWTSNAIEHAAHLTEGARTMRLHRQLENHSTASRWPLCALVETDDAAEATKLGRIACDILEKVPGSRTEPATDTTPAPEDGATMPEPTTTTPAPSSPAASADPLAAAIAAAVQPVVDSAIGAHLDQLGVTSESITRQIREAVAAASIPRPVHIKIDKGEPVDVGLTHDQLETFATLVELDRPVYLHGPAGSGKSYAAGQVARASGRKLCTLACVEDMDSFTFAGYKSAVGEYQRTEFYDAWCGEGEYSDGALIFIDEFDRAPGGVSIAFNQALADSHEFGFPCGVRKRHPNTRIALAGNTLMLGADSVYAAGQRQDGSTRDRVVILDWGYDEAHEKAVTVAEAQAHGLDDAKAEDWLSYVRSVRAAVDKLSLDYVISPRASYDGARILGATKLPMGKVRDLVIWSKIEASDRTAIRSQMNATGGE